MTALDLAAAALDLAADRYENVPEILRHGPNGVLVLPPGPLTPRRLRDEANRLRALAPEIEEAVVEVVVEVDDIPWVAAITEAVRASHAVEVERRERAVVEGIRAAVNDAVDEHARQHVGEVVDYGAIIAAAVTSGLVPIARALVR